jgi:ribosomal 50S subunit-recycling heat shock protein
MQLGGLVRPDAHAFFMRIDLFLKLSRLVPKRTLAQELCDAGLVTINGVPAKPGKEVKTGDLIVVTRRNHNVEAEVLAVPDKRQVSKADSSGLYRVVREWESENAGLI